MNRWWTGSYAEEVLFDEVEKTRKYNSVRHHWTLLPANLTSHGSTGWHLSSIPWSVYRGNRFWKSQKLDVKLHGWHDLYAWEIQSLTLEVYRCLASLVMVSASRPAARCFLRLVLFWRHFIMGIKGWVQGWLKLLFKNRVIFRVLWNDR